jgi:hypothetical protein
VLLGATLLGAQPTLASPPAQVDQPELQPVQDDTFCQDKCPDLGDAPDGNNSLGHPMSIHPYGLIAQNAVYPTEYTGAFGTGPIHWNAGANSNPNGLPGPAIDSALGLTANPNGAPFSLVSNERNAFRHPNGQPLDIDIRPCAPGNIQYAQFIRPPSAVNDNYAGPRFINVWIDFNRDGDWLDTNLGGPCVDGPGSPKDEWLVQNAPAPNASGVYSLPLGALPNFASNAPMWLRISIADAPAPVLGGGRGPLAGYKFGETEDHLLCFKQEAGQWRSCAQPRINAAGRGVDRLRIDPQKPIPVRLDVEEPLNFPVTVTLVISGAADFKEVTSTAAQIVKTPVPNRSPAIPTPEPRRGLVIQRQVPNAAGLRDMEIQLGWYGCITCTLALSANASPQGINFATAFPRDVSMMVYITEADGVESADEITIDVGWRSYLPTLLK